jgi:hypothetical protein
MLRVVFPIAAIVYGAYVLWPNSHCERALHASVPAYWAGSLLHLASEPFIAEPQTLEVSFTLAQRMQVFMGDAVARIFYNRDSLQDLCETDAIQLLRQAGRINDRGLIALPGERLAPKTPTAIPLAPASAAPSSATAASKAAQPHAQAAAAKAPGVSSSLVAWLGWLRDNWKILLVGLLAIAILIKPSRDALTKMVVEGKILGVVMSFARRLWMAHKQLLEHILPRSVIRPTAGKKKTDLSE